MSAQFAKFKTHLGWNYASFALVALSGIILNIVIGSAYGVEALGIFNLIYAIYVVASQFSVMGLHYSTLTHVAAEKDRACHAVIGYSALFNGLFISAACAVILVILSPLLGTIFNSPALAKGMTYIAPGLIFLSFNKILLWVLNGQKRMIAYAFGNMARAAGIIITLFGLVILGWPAYTFGLVFTLSDAALLIILLGLFIKEHGFSTVYISKEWIIKHLRFGSKAVWGGIIIETNFRVDVLMLGMMTSPAIVGIYSFAAMIAEGVFHLLFVIRTMINPYLVEYFKTNDFQAIRTMLKTSTLYLYPALTLMLLCAGLLYLPVINIMGLSHFTQSYAPLMILLIGMAIAGPFIPFQESFMQAGKSGRYSQFMGFIITINIVLNVVLIYIFGMIGAAIATAAAFIISIVIWGIMCKTYLGFNILKGQRK